MFLFWILASIVIVSALCVLFLNNPLHSALCLAVNLVAVAAIYALMGAYFLAAVQIIVYAGAIMVLVVFVLMLLNLKTMPKTIGDYGMYILALFSVGFCALIVFPVFKAEFSSKTFFASENLGVDSSSPNLAVSSSASVSEMGKRLFGEQAFLFQLTGVALLTAIIGAFMLASQRRQPHVSQSNFSESDVGGKNAGANAVSLDLNGRKGD